jgi:ABC-type dipeptide/oligopeptide/nickel transport system permease subunit
MEGTPMPTSGGATLAAVPPGEAGDHDLPVQQIGQWSLVWRRFGRHRLAVWSAGFLLFMVALAIVGPQVAPRPFVPTPSASGSVAFPTPEAPTLHPLSWKRIMGTDASGTSVSTYVLTGTRSMLLISVLGSLLALLVGLIIGGVAGYFGGFVEGLLMRIVDAFLTVPLLPFLMTLALYLTNRGALMYAVLFGLTGWAAVARLCRGSILSIREREYVEAARALGVSDAGVISRHLIPNILDVLIVAATLNVATYILAEASLDYLGVGTYDPTWAQGLRLGGNILGLVWYVLVFPIVPMLLTVLAVNFLGDGLRDALDSTSTAGLRYRETGARRGPVARGFAAATRAVRSVRALPLSPPRRLGRAAGGIGALPMLPAARFDDRRTWAADLPMVWRIVPIAVLFLACGTGFLYCHSPLRYSPHYSQPVGQIAIQDQTEFGALPDADGGWSFAYVDNASAVDYARTDANGATVAQRVLDSDGSSEAAPALAMKGRSGLAVWIHDQSASIDGAYVGTHSSKSFVISGRYTLVDHPYAVARPGGGYDVLFESTHGAAGIDDVYLATLPPGSTKPTRIRQLTHATEYAIEPRAVYDGSGHLDLIYMNRLHPGLWDWLFLRLNRDGHAIAPAKPLEYVQYYLGAPPNIKPDVVPTTWAAGVSRAPDGSVWATWGGDTGISVAHWSTQGRMIVIPTLTLTEGTAVPNDPTLRSVGIVATANGGVLYHKEAGEQEDYMASFPFNARGQPTGLSGERIAYDGGGDATLPHAGLVDGRPTVLWQKVRLTGGETEAVRFHPYQAPDLLTHLGLNIGPLWQNIGFLLIGAIGLGIGIATINLLTAAVLALLSIPILRSLPRFWAWPAYALLITLVLLALFARTANPPPFILIITNLAFPYGLVAALGGGALAWWAGRSFFRRQDDLFRAVSMALTGVAFVGAMYALIVLEGQIGRI